MIQPWIWQFFSISPRQRSSPQRCHIRSAGFAARANANHRDSFRSSLQTRPRSFRKRGPRCERHRPPVPPHAQTHIQRAPGSPPWTHAEASGVPLPLPMQGNWNEQRGGWKISSPQRNIQRAKGIIRSYRSLRLRAKITTWALALYKNTAGLCPRVRVCSSNRQKEYAHHCDPLTFTLHISNRHRWR